MPSVQTVFTDAHKKGASDVHIVVGHPVLIRIDGELTPLGKQKITAGSAEQFIKSVLGSANFTRLKQDREIDVSYALKSGVRLRVNCHFERGHVSLVARIVPSKIPSIDEIGLTEELASLCELKEGLILFTGPTGVGKSTTMAAMLHHINSERSQNIITLEDPVEFIYPEGKGVVRQRQYGSDFLSFAEALKHTMRQDPNIVMVGEMRDLETIAAALTLAETGHLIFATLHTPNTIQSIDRIIDVFPSHQQPQIRSQLSLSLKAIIAQRLVPCEEGGRIAVREVLLNSPAVANIIRDNRLQELTSFLQSGREKGMYTFEQDAKRLLKEGLISKESFEWISES